jgi:spore germination protein KC
VHKKIISMLQVAVLLLCCSGCWDSKDINDKAILATVLLDKQNGNYVFYVEVAHTDRSGGPEGQSASPEKFTIIRGEGKTLIEARDELDRRLKYPIYISAVRSLIITQNFAREDIAEYFNRLRADVEYRKKVISVTTDADPEELLNIFGREESVGLYIEKTLDQMTSYRQMIRRSSSIFIESLSSKYCGFLIPDIGINQNMIDVKGFSVVLGSKVVGFIPANEWNGIIFINAGRPEIEYVIPFEDKMLTFLISLNNRDIKPTYKNGIVKFDLKFDFKAELQYTSGRCPCKFTEKQFDQMSDIITSVLKKDIEDAINTSQRKFGGDYFDFNRRFHAAYPTQYHKMSWDKAYSKAEFNVQVKVKTKELKMFDYRAHGAE